MDGPDDASPLSAPDLRRLSDRLHRRALLLKDEVLRRALARRPHHARLLSLLSSAASRSDALSSDLSSALGLLSDDAPDAEIRSLAVQIVAARRELAVKEEALGVVEVVAGMVERVAVVRDDVKCGEILKAAAGVRALREGVGGGDGEEPRVFGMLRKEVSQCADELQELLAGLVEKSISFDIDSQSLRVVTSVDAGEAGAFELQQVLDALDVAGALDYGLAKVADMIVKHVMVPIICGDSDICVEKDQGNELECSHHLKLVRSSEPMEKDKGVCIYSRLIEVIKYIKRFVCYENSKWIHCFGKLTWSRISELIITHFLSKAVPEDASKIAAFGEIIKYTVEFEDSLKDMSFTSDTDGKEEKLSLFAYNVEIHFAIRKRNDVLARARQIILQCEFVSSPENCIDLLFESERCIISEGAHQLMALVQHTLEEVCLSSAKVAMELYHTARDVLLLYEAIIPIKLEKQLETNGQAAIIIHNDFLYLSQEVSALAFEYRSFLPSTIKDVTVFLDLALYFRQLSEMLMSKQVKLVGFSLKEALDGANGFQNTHQVQQFDLAKFTIDQVVFILERIRLIWEPLLPKSFFMRSMLELLDSVFSNMTNAILLLDDLAANETLQLQRLIHMTLQNSTSLIETLVVDANEKDALPSLCKFRKLGDLLDMPLRSITTAWENEELINCGFTSLEVVNFIKATFSDSPLRKECLWRIERNGTQ